MVILRQLEAKKKAIKIIHSCTTKNQIESAKKYVELYNTRFEDFLGYQELKRELEKLVSLVKNI